MKKYTFYEWYADDEGGTGVCLTNEYHHNLDGNKTFKIGEFNTVEELANVLLAEYPITKYPGTGYDDFQEAFEEAKELFQRITF